MTTLEELASIVRRTVPSLKKRGDKWVGLCPFHNEKWPSFGLFVGRDGKARFKCLGCQERGDAIDWLQRVEKKSYKEAGGAAPDPEIRQWREQERRREDYRQLLLDTNPDMPPEAEAFLGEPDSLTHLQLRLRRQLSR